MSANGMQQFYDRRSKHPEIEVVGQNRKPILFRKKSLVLKRNDSGTKTARLPATSKEADSQSASLVTNMFHTNLRRHSELHHGIIRDIDQNYKAVEVGFTLSHRSLTKEALINQQIKQQLTKNSEIQRSQSNYTRGYSVKFPAKNKSKEIKTAYSILTTSATHSTIERSDDIRVSKIPLLTMLQRKAQQFDARYSKVLELPLQMQNQQLYNQRKKAHIAYFRQKQSASSMCSSRNRLTLHTRTIDTELKQTSEAAITVEKQELSKVTRSKVQLSSCTFPMEAVRCHSRKKTRNNILILQQL